MKLVFVCSNNRYRSVIAAAIASSLAPEIEVGTAGLAFCCESRAKNGKIVKRVERASPAVRAFLREKKGLDVSGHKSRRLTSRDAEEGLLIAMTARQERSIRVLYPNAEVRRLTNFDVPDPRKVDIEATYDLIETAVRELLAELVISANTA
jgi:protein-tyrosine-phosphatase